MKKLFAALVALALLLTACALAEDEDICDWHYQPSTPAETSGDWEYHVLENGTAEITEYNGNAGTLDIPSELDGYKVTSIGNHAFHECCSLTSVTIPDSVTNIGVWAFVSCESLTSVTIPDSVTSIGYGAFSNCESLVSVIIPAGVTSTGEGTFSCCYSLETVIILDVDTGLVSAFPKL